MKKILIALLLFSNFVCAQNLEDVGIAKYAVLEVLNNNTPLRYENNNNAKRYTNLFKDCVLFADKQSENYYRVELKDGFYTWIDKKDVEVQAIIPEKRFENIEKISFDTKGNKYFVEIETPTFSAFKFEEDGGNLGFTLFDNHFDPFETKISSKNKKFKLESKIANEFNLKYENNYPLFGYDIEKTEKGYLLNIKKAPKINPKKPLKNISVIVDAGHGGEENGVVAFGIKEKHVNLQISKRLKKELQRKGAKVYLTRKNDKKVELYQRIHVARAKNADILLSIHQNSLLDKKQIDKKHGVGTYYYHPQALSLAQNIQKNLVLATSFKDDKVNHASFAITRATSQPSVLIECGYLIRKEECEKLIDKHFQRTIAKAIVKGIEEYLIQSFTVQRS